jgi:phage/plasmid primase-like uncharacterized protein
MSYMTFEQQKGEHLQFLQKSGLMVTELVLNSDDFIRSRADGESGRGEYAYKTVVRRLNNGMTGLLTWCRCAHGQISTYKTYGLPRHEEIECHTYSDFPVTVAVQETQDLGKIHKFWEMSLQVGRSEYLERKGVGSYGIRFRDNQYGKVAVVPVRDIQDNLRGYQILNANGSKVFAKGMQLVGFMHCLSSLSNGSTIGIAESYVTAATCLELLNMPMVTAFTSGNLATVVLRLHERYPQSPLIVFADNDMHLKENKGVHSAMKAIKGAGCSSNVLIPQFPTGKQGREYSDWNDLVHVLGRNDARKQLVEQLYSDSDARLHQYCNTL